MTVAPPAIRRTTWRQSWPALVVSATARLLLGTLLLLLAVTVVPRVAGWETSVVMSGSMAPTLEPGDVVVVRPVDAAQLTPGRIVLADDPDLPGELRMHRISAVVDGGLRLRGDANPQPDGSLVPTSAVHGVGALRLPFLGLPVVWASQGAAGPLLLTALGLVLLVGLALLHRGPDDDVPAERATPRAACTPFRLRPRRTATGAVRVLAVAGVALVLAGLPGAAPARAVFSSVSGNPSSTLASGTYYSCAAAVSAAGATQYYPLQETGGTTAVNKGTSGSAANATYSSSGITYAVSPGPRCAVGQDNAVRLDGSSGAIAANNAVNNPTTFSAQIWFSTTTTSGGKLIGFGNSQTGASGNYDRHIYMLNSGQLSFGVYDGNATHVVTSAAAYNDSRWHLATATFSGSAGMTLYVDGTQVGRDSTSRTAQNYTGYWRIGYDNMANWPNPPASSYFNGAVAQAAVFSSVLSAAEVAAQADAEPWTCADAAGSSAARATVYLPLQWTSGGVAPNAGTSGAAGNGTYSSSVNYTAAGPNCGTNVAGATQLNGSNGQVWTSLAVADPQSFTEQIWFATTTTSGGKLIGFGTATGGAQSNNYDRHIYMTNAGTLVFGIYNGGYFTTTSPGAYNDGGWHLATASFSAGTGMRLYVDGALVGTNTTATAAEHETGYWRIGYDSIGGWPSSPSSSWFKGAVAQASVYERVLAADEVAGQYLAGK